jgi:Cu/Ag efflux protein CusF
MFQMRQIKSLTLLPLLLVAGLAAAADQHAMDEKPSFFAKQSIQVTAKVEAINQETREVTLLRADGETISFTASDEARNLNMVRVGDIVNAEYEETLSIEVVANDGTEPEKLELAGMARAEEGQMPGMAAFDAQQVIATVEEINLEANTFKLKGPDGTVNEYVARNPDNLRKADVGDLVIITTTEAVAISVEIGPTE